MEFEWNPDKARSNLAKHHVAFEVVRLFDWEGAIVVPDERFDYGEARFVAYGRGGDGDNLVIAFTMRGPIYRIISVRAFGRKEYEVYGR